MTEYVRLRQPGGRNTVADKLMVHSLDHFSSTRPSTSARSSSTARRSSTRRCRRTYPVFTKASAGSHNLHRVALGLILGHYAKRELETILCVPHTALPWAGAESSPTASTDSHRPPCPGSTSSRSEPSSPSLFLEPELTSRLPAPATTGASRAS